jgi:hypothetical protein
MPRLRRVRARSRDHFGYVSRADRHHSAASQCLASLNAAQNRLTISQAPRLPLKFLTAAQLSTRSGLSYRTKTCTRFAQVSAYLERRATNTASAVDDPDLLRLRRLFRGLFALAPVVVVAQKQLSHKVDGAVLTLQPIAAVMEPLICEASACVRRRGLCSRLRCGVRLYVLPPAFCWVHVHMQQPFRLIIIRIRMGFACMI